MNVLYISGSPRDNSNTDYLLNLALSITDGQFLKLIDYQIDLCKSCWACQKLDRCVIDDDMSNALIPKLLNCDVVVLGSPVYFNNVSAQAKVFIDRTWCIRGKLRNKIGGAITVGRRYGLESAIAAINAFFLKHEMIPANRGVCGLAFGQGEIAKDEEAIESAKKLGKRIKELGRILHVE
jgi:multimeric flavodoxin WrbA